MTCGDGWYAMNPVSDSERLKLPVVGDAPNSHRKLFFSKPENAPLTQSVFPTGAGSILNHLKGKKAKSKGFHDFKMIKLQSFWDGAPDPHGADCSAPPSSWGERGMPFSTHPIHMAMNMKLGL